MSLHTRTDPDIRPKETFHEGLQRVIPLRKSLLEVKHHLGADNRSGLISNAIGIASLIQKLCERGLITEAEEAIGMATEVEDLIFTLETQVNRILDELKQA